MAPTAYVVDDHSGFRVAARELLESAGFEVVGVAGDGASALRDLGHRHVDLALVDLYLPGEDGADVARRIVSGSRATTVVIVSSREDAAAEPRVRSSGADCFIAKRDLSVAALQRCVG